jgi:hypothetical protein
MQGNWGAALSGMGQVMGPVLGILLIGLVVLLLCVIFYVKMTVKGKVIAFFHENKTFKGFLLKEDVNNACVWINKGTEKEEKYLLDANKIEWSLWPSALPRIMQEPVRCIEYIRRNPIPQSLDSRHGPSISANALAIATDEVMLRQTWKDARSSLNATKPTSNITMIQTIMMLVIGLVVIFDLMQDMNATKAITAIQQALGVVTGGK